jgi:transposase-like protein
MWIRMQLIPKQLTNDKTLTKTTELRLVKYLNHMVEQDHRFIKRLVNPGMDLAVSTQRGEP